MKKIISLVIMILLITACVGKKNDFYLTYNSKNIKLGEVFDTNKHGSYIDLFESANCAFGDRDITYMYDDIEIETYGNKKGELIIYSIRLTDDNVKTNENIGLYDSIEDAIKEYGTDYSKEGNKYTYKHGKTSLVFIAPNNIIESIEYRLNNLN